MFPTFRFGACGESSYIGVSQLHMGAPISRWGCFLRFFFVCLRVSSQPPPPVLPLQLPLLPSLLLLLLMQIVAAAIVPDRPSICNMVGVTKMKPTDEDGTLRHRQKSSPPSRWVPAQGVGEPAAAWRPPAAAAAAAAATTTATAAAAVWIFLHVYIYIYIYITYCGMIGGFGGIPSIPMGPRTGSW